MTLFNGFSYCFKKIDQRSAGNIALGTLLIFPPSLRPKKFLNGLINRTQRQHGLCLGAYIFKAVISRLQRFVYNVDIWIPNQHFTDHKIVMFIASLGIAALLANRSSVSLHTHSVTLWPSLLTSYSLWHIANQIVIWGNWARLQIAYLYIYVYMCVCI